MKGKRIAAFLLALSLVVSQEGLGRLTVQAQSPQEQTEQGPTETSEQKDDQGAVKDVKIDPAGSQPAEQAVSGESSNEQNADEAAAEGTNDSQAMIIGEDGEIPKNSYSHVKTLNCYSSKDMVNWTDEGIIQVAGKNGPA